MCTVLSLLRLTDAVLKVLGFFLISLRTDVHIPGLRGIMSSFNPMLQPQTCPARQGLAKAGVGITGDMQKLARDFPGLDCASAVCLSSLANQRLNVPPERWSLARTPPSQYISDTTPIMTDVLVEFPMIAQRVDLEVGFELFEGSPKRAQPAPV